MILEFYGKECPHCLRMEPIVEKLQSEGIKIQKFEIWHDEENKKVYEQYDTGLCGGVPFFINPETKKFICGEASYEELKDIAI